MAQQQHIHIVGGGLVGSLIATYMARRGNKVTVCEARPDMRRTDIPAGRSINLALSARGIEALKGVNKADEVLGGVLPMSGRMLHGTDGNLKRVPYGKDVNEVINSVSRGGLNQTLLTAAEEAGATVHFDAKCVHIDLIAKTATYKLDNDETLMIEADLIIGADGAGSQVREAMAKQIPDFECTQDFLDHGYKELTIPAGDDGNFQMASDALHIWPRGEYMLIALPNPDKSFTCTLFFPMKGEVSFEALDTEEKVLAFFEQTFLDAKAMMPTLGEDFFNNPTGSLGTVRTDPWHFEDKAVILGDAAHAIVPFFGQGMNAGFEDCAIFNRMCDEYNEDWAKILPAFTLERVPNANAIADMALENYVEMRDTTADPKFQLKKEVGLELERRLPGKFIPRYSMVSFHHEVPYTRAKHMGEVQSDILDKLVENAASIDDVDWSKAEKMILDHLR